MHKGAVPAHRLEPRAVERVWGRRDLPPGFPALPDADAPIGEIWFEAQRTSPLLVKYLFTAERLSIQVHPDDAAARARAAARQGRGLVRDRRRARRGDRARADPRSRRGRKRCAAAALDGSIERLLDWRPVKAGDIFYSPAGTIHAIGGGISLIEIQQNLDLTYRLYDYGRPRELHLDEAVAVAKPGPWSPPSEPVTGGARPRAASPRAAPSALERWTAGGDGARRCRRRARWRSGGTIDGEALAAGLGLGGGGGAEIAGGGIDLLVARSRPRAWSASVHSSGKARLAKVDWR